MAASAYVYVLGCPGGPCKVGWTTNLHSRMSRISEPAGLVEPIYIAEIPYRFGLKAERYAHWLLHENHYRNEWFSVEPEVAIDAVKKAVALDFDRLGCVPPLPDRHNATRFPGGTLDRIDRVLDPDKNEKRSDFIREAVEKELNRREKKR
jgi:hypothetical protein